MTTDPASKNKPVSSFALYSAGSHKLPNFVVPTAILKKMAPLNYAQFSCKMILICGQFAPNYVMVAIATVGF